MSNLIAIDRNYKILEIAQKKAYVTLNDLAEELQVSTRTIRNDMKMLNKELEASAHFLNEKGKGYHLHIVDDSRFKELIRNMHADTKRSDSFRNRFAFIIERLVNAEKAFTLDELAFEMNISKTTLVNELKKASVSLKTYNLEIIGKQNNGIQLIGDELNIRFFVIDHFYDYLYKDYPIDQDVLEEVIHVSNRYDLESTTQTKLIQFMVVMLDRLLNNHPLIAIDQKHERLLSSSDSPIVSEIVKAIERLLPVNLPKNEMMFMAMPIAGRRTPTNNRTLAEVRITDDVISLLESIVEEIGFQKEIIETNENLFKDLTYHLTFMLNRLVFGIRLKNPLIADLQEKYPVAFRMAKIAGQVVKDRYDLEPSEDELGYLAFYFSVLIAQIEGQVKKIKKAAVICGTGRGTARLIAIQLERILHQHTQLELFSEAEVTEELLSHFDIIFSTVELPVGTDKPLIVINEIFDESSIAKKIENAALSKNFEAHHHAHQSIISKLVTKEKFFLLDCDKSYEENLETMMHHLVANDFLDDGFMKRLQTRSEKGSMVFDRYIALPHTLQKKSDRIELAIGIFPETVLADGKEVKLVFLLGLPEHQSETIEHVIVKVYDEIIKIANQPPLMDKLSCCLNYEEFVQTLELSVN